jgi:transcriptional regulator GlxA family with amidase domain
VEAAKRALIETNSALDDITWNVGYSDIPGFRKLFIRFTGLSPSEFRRKYHSFYSTTLLVR